MQLHTLYGNKAEVYTADEVIPIILEQIKANCVEYGKGKRKRKVINTINTFDIETTTVRNDNSDKTEGKYSHFNYCFVWQACFNGVLCIGRHIDEYFRILDSIAIASDDIDARMIVYIHNSAYEFNNLAEYFFKGFTGADSVLMQSTVRPIFFRYKDRIEFRCSYLLTHKPLSKLSKEIGLEKGGDYDYNKPRHSNTPLTEREIEYSLRDVWNLYKWLLHEVKLYSKSIGEKSNVFNLPYTQTGYVRRELREKFSNTREGRFKLKDSELTQEEFQIVHKAFWGGDTHANTKYVGKVVKGVKHRDFTSAYPSAIVTELFPYGKYKHAPEGVKSLCNYLSVGYSVIATYIFENIRLKPNKSAYIPRAKCEYFTTGAVIENGRIVSADMVCITMCEIDFAVIADLYDFDLTNCYNIMYCKKRPLNDNIINVLLEFFKAKTTLKGVSGAEYEYNLSKQKLNSIYGCSAQSLEQATYVFNDNFEITEGETEYNAAKVLPYQYAVYITAYVRQRLNYFKSRLGDNFIYCDTDSIFYIPTEESEQMFERYERAVKDKINELALKYGIDNIAPENEKGERQYLFNFELEQHADENGAKHNTIDKFITIGAKRYIVQCGQRVDVTVSGLGYSKWDSKHNRKGANILNLERKYKTDIFNIFERMAEGEFFTLDYTEEYGELLNYNERGDFRGTINDGITTETVTARASMVLTPAAQTFGIEPTLFDYITTYNRICIETNA